MEALLGLVALFCAVFLCQKFHESDLSDKIRNTYSRVATGTIFIFLFVLGSLIPVWLFIATGLL